MIAGSGLRLTQAGAAYIFYSSVPMGLLPVGLKGKTVTPNGYSDTAPQR